MHPAIAEHRDEIVKLCRAYGVLRLEAFGSGARGTDFDPTRSDADFLVEFGPDRTRDPLDQFFGLAFALEEVIGRRVDLVEGSAITNPYLEASIDEDREIVYAP